MHAEKWAGLVGLRPRILALYDPNTLLSTHFFLKPIAQNKKFQQDLRNNAIDRGNSHADCPYKN